MIDIDSETGRVNKKYYGLESRCVLFQLGNPSVTIYAAVL